MTNEKIWEIAYKQSAEDSNCEAKDFISSENKIVLSKKNEKARKYLDLPLECDLVSYGSNVVAQASERLFDTVSKYVSTYKEYCFETPHIHVLDEALKEFGLKTCFMAEYFLPDLNRLKELPCKYEIKILYPKDFQNLYTDDWSNALCKKRKELDVMAVGAYDNGKLIGLAGCSADCEDMYQIGIDVLPNYRREGVASALTSKLALEILKLEKVAFYCAAWCNLKSVKNAIKCGFVPAWVALTAKEISYVEKLNER